MSDNCRDILRGALVFIAAVAVGLIAAWTVIKFQKPEADASPLEHVLPAQP